jgi:hypothetical protein
LVYLIIIHNTAASFDFDNAPFFHCFNVKDPDIILHKTMQSFEPKSTKDYSFFLTMLQYCAPGSCKKVIALCQSANIEQTLVLFVPLAVFLTISLLSIFYLSKIRSYGKIYFFTKRYARPIVHYSFLHDRLEDPTKGMAIMERLQLIKEAWALDNQVFNRKGKENSSNFERIFKNAQKPHEM